MPVIGPGKTKKKGKVCGTQMTHAHFHSKKMEKQICVSGTKKRDGKKKSVACK